MFQFNYFRFSPLGMEDAAQVYLLLQYDYFFARNLHNNKGALPFVAVAN